MEPENVRTRSNVKKFSRGQIERNWKIKTYNWGKRVHYSSLLRRRHIERNWTIIAYNWGKIVNCFTLLGSKLGFGRLILRILNTDATTGGEPQS